MNKNWSKETLCINGGYNAKQGEPVALPIVQSTSYGFESADYVADLFDLKEEGHLYTRISNPTVAALEEKFTKLEKGVGAVAVASGQAATLLSVLNICNAGDNIVSLANIYGGTFNLFANTLKKFGIETIFINQNDSDEKIETKINERTRLIFGEVISNPGLDVLDIERFSRIARKNNIPLVVDNTISTPYLVNPFEYGANIVVHSTSKYADGHSVSLGGIIIDGGNFNWENGKFNELVEPDVSYHGLRYVDTFKESAYIVKLRVTLLRDLGSTMSPFNAFLTNLGLETLHLRVERHSSNALTLAKFLRAHKNVNWVKYPLLDNEKELGEKYLSKGASGLLSFGIKGGRNSAKQLVDKLSLAKLVVHLGDVRTTFLHPATTTHRQLSDDELIAAGISEDLIRVSVGIENIDDIINDFNQALNNLEV